MSYAAKNSSRLSHLVDVLPAAAVRRLHEDREAEVARTPRPSRRSRGSGRTSRSCSAGAPCAGGGPSAGRRRPPASATMLSKNLSSARPPDRVVDDLDAARDRALEERPVERDLVADPVEDHGVLEGLLLDECPILTGPASTSSPHFAAISLISFMSAHGKVSSIPNRTPILFTCHGCLPSRRAPHPSGRARRAANAPRVDSAAMKREYGSWMKLRALAPAMEFLWFGDRGLPRPHLPDLDGALLPERGLRPHGRARGQGRRRLPPARLRRLRRRGELVQQEGAPARPRPAPRRLRPLPAGRDAPVHREPRRRQRRHGRRELRRVPRGEPRRPVPGARDEGDLLLRPLRRVALSRRLLGRPLLLPLARTPTSRTWTRRGRSSCGPSSGSSRRASRTP